MIAILHPFILHYRQEFFLKLGEKVPTDIFCYQNPKNAKKMAHERSNIKVENVKAFTLFSLLFYSPVGLLNKKYDTLLLMFTFKHITTLLLLITKPLHRKKIILMGHGISISRYLTEQDKPNVLLKWMVGLADGVWLYTENEVDIWKRACPNIKAVSINNTISGIDEIVLNHPIDKQKAKEKYGITQNRIFIYCARFNVFGRREDLLEEFIERSDVNECGFIIIGEGIYKPNFKRFKNVYDFGSVYDSELKSIFFNIADIYIQPGWVGLSIVEAMGYGKPVFTFKRSPNVWQCVEYFYIINNYNGLIFEDIETLVETAKSIADNEILRLGKNAQEYVKENLTMENMVTSAYNLYLEIQETR